MNVFKAYLPSANFTWQREVNLTLVQLQAANGWPNLCQQVVPGELSHRKIWALAWSTSATFAIDADLTAWVSGSVVYRQRLVHWTTAASNDRWYSGFSQVTAFIGAQNENIFANIQGTLFCMSPWRLNIACDKIAIKWEDVSGAAANFDTFLACLSQQGV